MDIQIISGGVCAPSGFRAGGVHCGIRRNRSKRDLGMIVSDVGCTAAGVFTQNRFKAAPVLFDIQQLENAKALSGEISVILCNSGNANACAPDGYENAVRMAEAAAKAAGVDVQQVLVSSTGVIGQRLNIEAIEGGIPTLYAALSADGSGAMAEAIMTTDLIKKEIAVQLEISGKPVKIGGIAKGSGMIHPNMATMLAYVTTDAAISAPTLQKALTDAVRVTFNRVSVDGDTSTNDTCLVLASGLADNAPIESRSAEYDVFLAGLTTVLRHLAREVARDGEGATKLLTCTISGTASEEKAERLAKSVICSPLVKAAMFGSDANCGRVLCAMGYAGVDFDPGTVDVRFESAAGSILVCKDGEGVSFDEALAKKILDEKEIVIACTLGEGAHSATAWGCDLTYDYVKINGDYRT